MARYVQRFSVEGRGEFPFDMLRYDYCYPASSEAAVLIECPPRDLDIAPRQIQLSRVVDHSKVEPTKGRWESFGWRVVPNTIRMSKL